MTDLAKTITRELVINNDGPKKGFADTYIFEPETEREKRYGRLFIAGEIAGKPKQGKGIIDGIAEVMQWQYYKGIERDPLVNFETSLNKVNEILAEITEKGVASWIGNLNIIIAVLKDNDLHVSTTGKADALLIRNGEIASIKAKDPATAPPDTPLKTFSNVASGRLYLSDRLLLTTPGIFKSLSRDKILRTIDRYSVPNAIDNFYSLLYEYKTDLSIASLLIEISDQEEALAPTKGPKVNTYYEAEPAPSPTTATEKTPSSVQSISDWLSGAKSFVAKIPAKTKKNLIKRKGAKIFTGDKKKARGWKKSLETIFKLFITWFQKLNTKRKILFVSLVTLVIIFIVATLLATTNKNNSTNPTDKSLSIEEIGQNLDDAEASLIYGDDERATELINTSETALNAILEDDSNDEEALALIARITDIRGQADRRTMVTLTTLANYDKISGNPVLAIDIQKTGEDIYAIDANQKQAIATNTISGESRVVEIDSSADPILGATIKNSTPTILTNQPELLQSDGNKFLAVKKIFAADKIINSFDLTAYGNHLYALIPAENNLFRYADTGDSYGNAETWMTDTQDLSDAVSFAIDGNIYILKADGSIIRMFRGTLDASFTTSNMPEIKKPLEIQTLEGWSNVYVLDGDESSILVLDKQGTFKEKYTWEGKTVRDMYVDETTGKAFIITDNELLSFEL